MPALRSLRQKDLEFKAVQGYVVRPCLEKEMNRTRRLGLSARKIKTMAKKIIHFDDSLSSILTHTS